MDIHVSCKFFREFLSTRKEVSEYGRLVFSSTGIECNVLHSSHIFQAEAFLGIPVFCSYDFETSKWKEGLSPFPDPVTTASFQGQNKIQAALKNEEVKSKNNVKTVTRDEAPHFYLPLYFLHLLNKMKGKEKNLLLRLQANEYYWDFVPETNSYHKVISVMHINEILPGKLAINRLPKVHKTSMRLMEAPVAQKLPLPPDFPFKHATETSYAALHTEVQKACLCHRLKIQVNIKHHFLRMKIFFPQNYMHRAFRLDFRGEKVAMHSLLSENERMQWLDDCKSNQEIFQNHLYSIVSPKEQKEFGRLYHIRYMNTLINARHVVNDTTSGTTPVYLLQSEVDGRLLVHLPITGYGVLGKTFSPNCYLRYYLLPMTNEPQTIGNDPGDDFFHTVHDNGDVDLPTGLPEKQIQPSEVLGKKVYKKRTTTNATTKIKSSKAKKKPTKEV